MPQLMKIWSSIGLDGALLILGLLSGVLAMYRGLTRELLTIANWIVAGLAGWMMFQQEGLAGEIAGKYGQSATLVRIALTAVTLLIVLVVMYFVTSRFSEKVLDSRVGMIDRILGFGFGALRGGLIVVIAFMFYTKFFPIAKDQEASIPNARALPYVQRASESLGGLLEPVVNSVLKKFNPGGRDGEETPDRPGQQKSLLGIPCDRAMASAAAGLYKAPRA